MLYGGVSIQRPGLSGDKPYMRRRTGDKRNLAIFAAALAVMTILVVLASTQKNVVIMPPEPDEIIEKRRSPENAYHTIVEALQLLPEKPTAITVPDDEYPTVQVQYRPEKGSIGDLLNINRPDDDPGMLEYIDKCESAIERARAAFDLPYFMQPPIGGEGRRLEVEVRPYRLNFVMVARGIRRMKTTGADHAAFTYFMDALRLGIMVTSEGSVLHYGPGRGERQALVRLARNVPQGTSRDLLTKTTERMDMLYPGVVSARPYIEFTWREMDNETNVLVEGMRGHTVQRVLRKAWFGFVIRRERRYVVDRRTRLVELASMSYPEYRAMRWSRPDEYREVRNICLYVFKMVEFRADRETVWTGARAVLALETYWSDHGSYPETLDLLVPEYLDSVPMDAFSRKPMIYRIDDDRYSLYSVGRNMDDDWKGGPGGHVDDIVFRDATDADSEL